jgi:hypothetical protein
LGGGEEVAAGDIIPLNNHGAPLGVVGRTVMEATTADGKIRTNVHAVGCWFGAGTASARKQNDPNGAHAVDGATLQIGGKPV